ncbi:hypothetical protein [Nannocystis sp. SCPEA4]|uniref:hypothetical protein n=1 Tax=Nannocystis sp. SCPEA4 TaxID=2996787 RepID=UPI00226FFA92|nr:hypothetical protein [Nannocystis sp. SCPEA4]MCY1055408.1 hypothetical protein [Nannocystis sp. SCPEA4]
MNDKSEKKSRKPFVIALVIVAVAILVFVTKAKCPIPVPADQTAPKIEAKKEEPLKLDPKLDVPVIGDPQAKN